MKSLKPLLFFLVAVIAATAILSFFLPTSQEVERSITIKAPAATIYQELSKLATFNQFSVWSQQDTSAVYTLEGTDGTLGASSSWKGDPGISGEGKIEILSLDPGKQVVHQVSFIQPRKRTARSVFTLNEINGLTTVTWNFKMGTPRPWNIFNLFYSMDKEMGKDFDYSLSTLKSLIEGTDSLSAKNYEVMTMDLAATSFAMIRQRVKWADIGSFYSEHMPIIYGELQKSNTLPGTASGLFFKWDDKTQETDLAAAIEIPKGTVIDHPIVKIIDIPGSKAVFVNYYGSYEKERDAYTVITKYLTTHALKQRFPSIEQYLVGPAMEKDSSKWVTRIIFPVE